MVAAALLVAASACASAPEARRGHLGAMDVPMRVAKTSTLAGLGTLSLSFIENRGQLDEEVAYYTQGRDTSVYFRPGGVSFAPASGNGASSGPAAAPRAAALHVDFVGARPVSPVGERRAPGVVSSFLGPRQQWKTGLATYAKVVYRDLWPGVDAIYGGTERQLKYSFVVHPGADAAQIRLAYRGTTGARVTPGGILEISTPAGPHTEARPYTYQEVDGRRVEVASSYAVGPGPEPGTSSVRLPVGRYDRTRSLIVDPAIAYAGFLGGSKNDTGIAIAVDGTGAAYVTGQTGSPDFPYATPPPRTESSFLAKVDASGVLVYAVFLAGAGESVAVDGAGAAYIAGSGGPDSPVAVGPDLTHNGGGDAYVAKISATGTGLDYAGFIGGANPDAGFDIAVDSSGAAYVTGITKSPETSFPAKVGPDVTYNEPAGQSEALEPQDIFVAKVRPDGAALDYAGYIGGDNYEGGWHAGGFDPAPHIAVDGAGAAYVSGATYSTESTFPVTAGPDLTFNSSTRSKTLTPDAFVVKVRPDGTGFAYAGYIGGGGYDWAAGVAVDDAGSAYVAGVTTSGAGQFPNVVGPDLHRHGKPEDAFIVKVTPDGTGVAYGGFIGGGGRDVAQDVAVDGSGAAHVVGYTSSQRSFPGTADGFDPTYNGGAFDGFLVKVVPDGTTFAHGSFVGGAREDSPAAVVVDDAGAVYMTGRTNSDQATFPVAVGPDLTFNSDNVCTVFGGGPCFDAFVMKVSP